MAQQVTRERARARTKQLALPKARGRHPATRHLAWTRLTVFRATSGILEACEACSQGFLHR
eukprot:3993499-Alexandrium_andersonii.AAC.1